MKILFALILVLNCELSSQNLIDPPSVIESILLPNGNQFNFSNLNGSFVRAWNWGGSGSLLDSAMHMNMYHSAEGILVNRVRYGGIHATSLLLLHPHSLDWE